VTGKPDLDEIASYFTGILDGRISRDTADSWAGRWLLDDDLEFEFDEPCRWALDLLYGIDLTHGGPDDYLHDEEQIRGWLAELRERRR